jgi:putative chitinase
MSAQKRLFDAIREVKGSPLTQADVDRINKAFLPPAVEVPRGLQTAPVAAPGRDYEALLVRAAGRKADAKISAVAAALAKHAPVYGQDATPARLAEFVAQIANETGGFSTFEENLNYRAARLVQVWPNRFPNTAAAAPYANNPEALANKTYGGRMGNTELGDGWRFRGRGALQLTGRDNYRRYGRLLNLPLEDNPDLASDPAVSVQIALEFFKQAGVNAAIDRGDFRQARKLTNGGYIGVDEVARIRNRLLQVL